MDKRFNYARGADSIMLRLNIELTPPRQSLGVVNGDHNKAGELLRMSYVIQATKQNKITRIRARELMIASQSVKKVPSCDE